LFQRKKVYDCFIFYNELDLLEYRLNVLESVVDYFVIVESTLTFTGEPKELYYSQNKDRFSRFNIIHIVVDDFPFQTVNVLNEEQWKNERFQRNCITRGLLSASPDDVIIISDIDEIPNPSIDFKSITELYSLEQHFFYYTLHNRMDHLWYFPKVLPFKLITTCDEIRNTSAKVIQNGGWHLSYFGNVDFVKNKIKNFSHQEFNNEKVLNNIYENMKNSKDLFDRNIKISCEPINMIPSLPPMYEKYLSQFIKPCKEFDL
jgi:beta-1,4-mannosyl-glycoprotein beta-1,4-N-acetylglucosaminyltransferase